MKFGQAVRTCLNKYADFNGRASRSEFWWWILFFYLGYFIIIVFLGRVVYLWEIGLFIPGLTVAVRRMHDSNHSGWWVICPIANIVFTFLPPVDPNRYGVGAGLQGMVDESQLSATSTLCPTCGKLRLPGQNFCQSCGTKFE